MHFDSHRSFSRINTGLYLKVTKWRGKIEQSMIFINQVILLETLQYILSEILQTRWPVILDVVVCRHATVPDKIVSIVGNSPYST